MQVQVDQINWNIIYKLAFTGAMEFQESSIHYSNRILKGDVVKESFIILYI